MGRILNIASSFVSGATHEKSVTKTNLVWNGEEITAAVKSGIAIQLKMAMSKVETQAKKNISIAFKHKWLSGTEERLAVKQEKGIAVFVKKTVQHFTKDFRASTADEFPRKRTGHLRKNVTHEVDRMNLSARVGTNVPYGKLLEIKSPERGGRPWLMRTIREMSGELKKHLAGAEIKKVVNLEYTKKVGTARGGIFAVYNRGETSVESVTL